MIICLGGGGGELWTLDIGRSTLDRQGQAMSHRDDGYIGYIVVPRFSVSLRCQTLTKDVSFRFNRLMDT